MSILHRSLVLVALSGLLGGAVASFALTPAPASAADDAVAFYEKQYKGLAKAAASKLWGAASSAMKSGFNQFARETAQRAIDFDEDHKDARELLNWEKKGGKWVRNVEAENDTQKLNTKNTKEAQQSFDKRVEKWKEQLEKVEEFIAAKYAQAGEKCRDAGHEEQALKCFERALSHDKHCAAAMVGLGYEKVGAVWLTPKQKAAIEAAQRGEAISETSRLEKALGIKLNKMQSPHFRVEDDGAAEALPEAIRNLETLYCYFLADIGMDPTTDVFAGNRVEFCVVSTQGPWEVWVDQFSNTADPVWTKENNTFRSYLKWVGGVKRVETAEHIDTRDPLLNHASHFLTQQVWKASRFPWLDEGLAYYYTIKVQGTTRTHTVEKILGDYADDPSQGGDKDWAVSERWKEYLAHLVGKNDDIDLRTIMTRPLATLDLPQTVKAWGVISWLMDEQREKFIEFATKLRDADTDEQIEVWESVFGSIEGLDKRWREYAKRAY